MKSIVYILLVLMCVCIEGLPQVAGGEGLAFGGKGFDRGVFTRPTSDGGLLTVGYTSSFSSGVDAFLVKTDMAGNKSWELNTGGAKLDIAFGFAELPAGGYLVAGFSSSYSADEDITLWKVSPQGEILWIKNLARDGRERCWSIGTLADGNFLLVGQTQDLSTKNYFGMLTKIDAQGKVLWQEIYGDLPYHRAFYFVETAAGDIVATGICRADSLATNNGWIFTTDRNGRLSNSIRLASHRHTTPHGILKISEKSILVAGYAQLGAIEGEHSVYLALVDAYGKLQWEKGYYEKGLVSHGLSAARAVNGDILIAGFTGRMGEEDTQGALYAFDISGDFRWKREFGGRLADEFYTIASLPYNQYAVTGHTYSYGAGAGDLWLVYLSASGDLILK